MSRRTPVSGALRARSKLERPLESHIVRDRAMSKFKASSSYSRESVVTEFVKTVGSTSMDYSLAGACAAGVEAELARTATKS